MVHSDHGNKRMITCLIGIIMLYLKNLYRVGNWSVSLMGVMDAIFYFMLFSAFYFALQPCQVIYQVCHESVERLIQYGILLVAEVR